MVGKCCQLLCGIADFFQVWTSSEDCDLHEEELVAAFSVGVVIFCSVLRSTNSCFYFDQFISFFLSDFLLDTLYDKSVTAILYAAIRCSV